MTRIRELYAALQKAGKTFLVELSQPTAEIDQKLLGDRIRSAEAIIAMMKTPGWSIYMDHVKQLKEQHVKEFSELPATSPDSAVRLKQGLICGLDQSLETADAIITAGELAEQELNKLIKKSDQQYQDQKRVHVQRM